MNSAEHPINKVLSDYAFYLSLLVVMAVFLPVNYFEFINFDDVDVINRIHRNHGDIPWQSFLFRSYSIQYYRPLLEVLCYMDYALWGLTLNAWHLTNYIIHLLNACLVYFIALKWFHPDENQKVWASFAMLYFALNPLTCESVAWISGRSDLAGTFFSLLSVYFFYTTYRARYVLIPSAILAGLLCKENALAVIPLIVSLEIIKNFKNNQSFKELITGGLFWGGIVLIPFFVYLFLRTNGFESYFFEYEKVAKPLMTKTAAIITADHLPERKSFLFLFPVIAFYLKKLTIPFPLNFAIIQINTVFYSFLFVFISGINAVACLKKRWGVPVFTFLLVVSFSPALLIALGKIAWTPMAERYIYLSLSIMGIGVGLTARYIYHKKIVSRRVVFSLCTLLIAVLTVTTFNRLFDFKDSKSIWAATLKRNPESSMVLCKYGEAAQGEEGKIAFQKAVSNPKPFKWRAKAYLVLSQYAMREGRIKQGLKYIEKALETEPNYKNYSDAAAILSGTVGESEELTNITDLKKKAIFYYKKAYSKKKNLFVLYKTATLLNIVGERNEAVQVFKTIIQNHPTSQYASYAKKHLAD